ncbi:translocation and assembly module lipoprotein TamL [Flavobacterium sp. SUN052]|uniref:translocation and assembly module lipoprotein TamL n=1 Tax=Flavobacterium sp. SUN052 TaxID=3002441 RepID=UPI003FA3B531
MKNRFTKISLFILIGLIIVACNTTKRVPNGKRLLMKNEISIDDKATKDENVFYQLYQKPNSSILGYRLRLNLYNLSKKNADTSYAKWLNKNPKRHARLAKLLSEKQVQRLGKSFLVSGWSNFLMKTGEAPVLFDSLSTKKSLKRLESYYYNKGYFDVKATYTKDTIAAKKTSLKYKIALKKPYFIDSLTTSISTPALDSLYQIKKSNSLIKTGKQYDTENLINERNRITTDFRNNGAFLFQPNYITNTLDTIDTGKKVNINLTIKDYSYRDNDSTKTAPFKLYKIKKVAIYTDQSNNKNEIKIKDSLQYKDYILYSEHKLKYRPKAITDAIFITKGSMFSDNNTLLTTRYLSNLRVFNYPTIQYKIDPKDENALVANIFLTPRKKYTFGASVDFTHSNIQDFGISGNSSVGIRNVFNGAETFEIGFRGNVGASKDLANPNNNFFNISEIGVDAKLSFPRIFFPFNTDKIILKSMIPSTSITVGFAKQRNIGLDKQNFTSTFSYNWTPKKNINIRYDLFNIQFVKNVNVGNYFNIYQSSYNALNVLANNYNFGATYFSNNQLTIENGTNAFIDTALGSNTLNISEQDLKTIRSIDERKKRLTENNLIFASSLSYSKTTNKGLLDNNFYSYKTKIESAGNLLSILARASKQLDNQSGANTFFEVEYSQYLKGEFEYIKHWTFSGKKVFAVRGFAGLAVPYGNSTSIPFSRSYFSGGSNDIRAWQPYSLGPGKSGGLNDFNEANMKLTFSAELRFNMFGKFNGALFTDAGNIWNVFDNVTDEAYTFNGVKSLKTIAVGTGFGLRYDQGIFVIRFDLGFKTYNPAKETDEKWLKEINLSKSVLNIGINYPF